MPLSAPQANRRESIGEVEDGARRRREEKESGARKEEGREEKREEEEEEGRVREGSETKGAGSADELLRNC